MTKTISREEEKAAREAIAENRKILAEAKKQENEAYALLCKELEDYAETVVSRWNEDEFADLRKVLFTLNDWGCSTVGYYPISPSLKKGYYGMKSDKQSMLWRKDKLFKELESCIAKDGTIVSTCKFRNSSQGCYIVSYDRIFILTFSFFYRSDNDAKKSIAKTKKLLEAERFSYADENKLLRDLFKKSLKQA